MDSQIRLWLDSEYEELLDTMSREFYATYREQSSEDAMKVLREQIRDVQVLGVGSGRAVISLPTEAYSAGQYDGYVVKLAVPNTEFVELDGIEQNMRERNVWEESNNGVRTYLTPVVAAGADGYWVVMPCGTPLEEGSMDGFDEWKTEAADALEGVVPDDDIESSNVTVIDGEFQLCDYGVSPN